MAVTMKDVVFWDITPQFVLLRRHIMSPLQSPLQRHSGDYEEWRLLRNKNPVRTSQERHYVSATESSQLMLCNIWGSHGSDYEECHLLGYKTPVLNSQEPHYLSATETSQLMLCTSWGSHDGDYEECHLLGYKISVPTSQETHYVSATEASRLMLSKIWGFQGGDYKECRLLSDMLRRVALVFLRSLDWFLVTAVVVPSSPVIVTLMMEAIRPSETSVLTRATRRSIPRRRHSTRCYVRTLFCRRCLQMRRANKLKEESNSWQW
jgi:hypothetical protein